MHPRPQKPHRFLSKTCAYLPVVCKRTNSAQSPRRISKKKFISQNNRYLCTFLKLQNIVTMEKILNLQIEKLPEGVYLATSDSIQGLVVQGNSITETIEIARDVAKKLIEAQEHQITTLTMFNNSFNYPLVVSV